MGWLDLAGSLASAAGTAYAANQAGEAQIDAAERGIDLQRQIYNRNRQDMAPYRAAGYGALDQQTQLLGLGPAAPGQFDAQAYLEANPDVAQRIDQGGGMFGVDADAGRGQKAYGHYRQFGAEAGRELGFNPITKTLRQTPGYQFARDQGMQAVERSQAANGMALSGNTLTALQDRGMGIADQTYGNQLNRMASLAGTGQAATQNTASMGQQFGSNAANALGRAGQAQANMFTNYANTGNQLLKNLNYTFGGN